MTRLGLSIAAACALCIVGAILVLERAGRSHPIASCATLAWTERSTCVRAAMRDLLDQKGMGASLEELDHIAKDAKLSGMCHAAAHALGAAAYRASSEGRVIEFSPAMDTCSFGFFHGYIIGLRAAEGSLKNAVALCDGRKDTGLLADNFPRGECFHGIGNAIVDDSSLDWTAPVALLSSARSTCIDATNDDASYMRCMGGVYNSMANAYGSGRLSRDSAPSALCDTVSDATKSLCEGYLWGGYYRISSLETIAETMPTSLPLALRQGVVVANMVSKSKAQEILSSDVPAHCGVLPSELRPACVGGYADGLVQLWGPSKHPADVVDFCTTDGITSEEQSVCLSHVLTTLAKYLPPSVLEGVCPKVAPSLRAECQRLVQGGTLQLSNALLTDPNIKDASY